MNVRKFAFSIIFCTSACFATTVRYSITEITSPNSENGVIPNTITDDGLVSAYSWSSTSVSFIYHNGQYETVSSGTGLNFEELTQINDVGEGIAANDETGKPSVWNGKSFESLPIPPGANATDYYAADLNDHAQLVGAINGFKSVGDYQESTAVPVLWQNGVPTILPTLAGTGMNQASAVNNSGIAVGSSVDSHGVNQAVMWQNGHIKTLGTLGGSSAGATTINDQGIVAGWADTRNGNLHAFEWSNGKMIDLGPTANVFAINDENQIVGNYDNTAVLWQNGERIDLNTLLPSNSGWTLTGARDINDHGQIVGIGLFDGHARGFVMTPNTLSSPAANAIPLPDPGTAGLFASPLVIFAMRRSLRKQEAP